MARKVLHHMPLSIFSSGSPMGHISPLSALRTTSFACLGGFIHAPLLPRSPLILHNSILFMTHNHNPHLYTIFNISDLLICILSVLLCHSNLALGQAYVFSFTTMQHLQCLAGRWHSVYSFKCTGYNLINQILGQIQILHEMLLHALHIPGFRWIAH